MLSNLLAKFTYPLERNLKDRQFAKLTEVKRKKSSTRSTLETTVFWEIAVRHSHFILLRPLQKPAYCMTSMGFLGHKVKRCQPG